MFKRTKLSASLLIAFGGVIATTPAVAQQELERVEITGSSIRRVESEGALPVQVIRRDDIEKTGATSVVDLLQKLPAMQGATNEAASTGGGGAGFAGVSIHNIGETRTLVLLNGRRLAQFGGQTLTGFAAAIDLNSLPLSAIERVEILSDGASALYGSDAVAGVVNFITRRNSTAGEITVGYSKPQDGGAEEKRINFSKGFGDLDADGFNLLFALSYDKRDPLKATDRDFASSGRIQFERDGKRYQATNTVPSSNPANIFIPGQGFRNPYFEANGECGPGTLEQRDPGTGNTSCYFDFVSNLEIFPERERTNLMTSFTKTLGNDHTLYADVLLSNSKSTGVIAPVPGAIRINRFSDAALWDAYVEPLGPGTTSGGNVRNTVFAYWRIEDLGKRIDNNDADFRNVALGLKGLIAGWDYDTAITASESEYKNSISGYPGGLSLRRVLGSGELNPFLLVGQQSPAGQALLDGIRYDGYWDGGKSKLTTFDIKASRELAQLAGGALAIGTGFNVYQEKFQSNPSLFAQAKLSDPVTGALCTPGLRFPDPDACDQRFGDSAQNIPYSADRKAYGAFVELVAPVAKDLELTGALRFDDYEEVGSTVNAKGSFRWAPKKGFLVRGSLGTGFKAPTVPQLAATPQPYGVTTRRYSANADLQTIADELGAVLRSGNVQYDVVAGGNPNLEPEKSRQGSIGFVFEPIPEASIGMDLWHIQIRDAFGQLTEEAVFGDPLAYRDSWTTNFDVATSRNYLALKLDNRNLGKSYSTGIDFNLQSRVNSSMGRWTNQLVATYMLREDQQIVPGGPYYSAIGKADPFLGVITFRWQGRLTSSLETGNWRHTLQTNFKTGYKDDPAFVDVLDDSGQLTGDREKVQLRIKPFFTFDWQSEWQATKSVALTAGILNVLDEDPPLALGDSGAQQYGYEDRYYDSRGRTFYVNARFNF